MNTLIRLRNFWIPWVTTIVLACFSAAVAQESYRVTDLGTLGNDNLGCAMSVNNQGWTEIMAGNVEPGQQDSASGKLLNGRAVIDVDGLKIDLGTLGGPNSWMIWARSTSAGKRSVMPKHLFQIRTAKTFAASAQNLHVVRFFGEAAT